MKRITIEGCADCPFMDMPEEMCGHYYGWQQDDRKVDPSSMPDWCPLGEDWYPLEK